MVDRSESAGRVCRQCCNLVDSAHSRQSSASGQIILFTFFDCNSMWTEQLKPCSVNPKDSSVKDAITVERKVSNLLHSSLLLSLTLRYKRLAAHHLRSTCKCRKAPALAVYHHCVAVGAQLDHQPLRFGYRKRHLTNSCNWNLLLLVSPG